MEAIAQHHSHLSLDHHTHSPLDHHMSSSSASSPPSHTDFLKMEDLHTQSASPAPESFDTSPPPVFVQSKPAKKRKSWGQELPEPKTTLPPRKRAKTDDEKEQRRIERIKRNRAAAHNSRERKRQETETLAVALAKANAELEAYKKLHGPLPAHIILPEVHLSVDDSDNVIVSTPAPSLVESHGSLHDPPSPASPTDSIFENTPQIKQEPYESSSFLNLPPAFDSLDAKPTLLSPLDPTQHSAVSVQPSEQQQQQIVNDFGKYLVDSSLSLTHDFTTPDMLPHPSGHALDSFAFMDGASDACFNPPLNFSFDDLIDDSATFSSHEPGDAQAAGAV